MRHKVLLGWMLSFSLVLISISSRGLAMDYAHKIDIDQMSFAWTVDGQNLHVKLSAKTTGWVAVGFNPSHEMKDANFLMGFVKDGKAKVADHFGTTTRQHEKDKKIGGKRNVKDVAGKEENGVTEVSFTIPLDSKDPKDQPLSIDKETTVLLAYGSGRDSFRAKHQFKTALKVNLGNGQYKPGKP